MMRAPTLIAPCRSRIASRFFFMFLEDIAIRTIAQMPTSTATVTQVHMITSLLIAVIIFYPPYRNMVCLSANHVLFVTVTNQSPDFSKTLATAYNPEIYLLAFPVILSVSLIFLYTDKV